MTHVFISYYREDLEFAERTIQKVETELGVECWQDRQSIRAGEGEWFRQIEKAIWDSFALVLIVTPEALQRPYIIYEWTFALGAGITVIPIEWTVIPDELWQEDPHKRLRTLQGRNVIQDDPHEWEQLFADLRGARAKKVGAIHAPTGASGFIKNAAADLKSTEAGKWRHTIKALEECEDPHAAQILKMAAEHHHMRLTRYQAAFAHVRHTNGSDFCWPTLEDAALQEKNRDIQQAAWAVLGDFGGPRSIEILTRVLTQETHTSRRRSIIHQLGNRAEMGDGAAFQPLVDHWQRVTDVNERQAIIVALKHFKTNEAAEFLLGVLSDLLGENHQYAVCSLALIGTEVAIEGVKNHIVKSESRVRVNAIKGLDRVGYLKREGVITALQILEDVGDGAKHDRHMVNNQIASLRRVLPTLDN